MTWILNNKRITVMIALFLCLLFTLDYVNNLKGKLNKAEQVKAAAIVDAIKPYEQAMTKAKSDALAKEWEYSQNLIKAEQNANQKIKAANIDADRANVAADSMSKQLEKAKRNMPSASRETIIKYVEVNTDVLKHCVSEYRTMAEAADTERIDKEKLIETWPE